MRGWGDKKYGYVIRLLVVVVEVVFVLCLRCACAVLVLCCACGCNVVRCGSNVVVFVLCLCCACAVLVLLLDVLVDLVHIASLLLCIPPWPDGFPRPILRRSDDFSLCALRQFYALMMISCPSIPGVVS